MPQVYQHRVPFKGDAFDIFHLFKDRPRVFFLDSGLHHKEGRFSYIGFEPYKTVRDLPALKKELDKCRLKRQRLPFPAGAVGYLGYDGSVFFGIYDTVIAIDHQCKQLIVSSFLRIRIKEILKHLSSGGEDLRLTSARQLLKSPFKGNPFLAADRAAIRQEEHVNRKAEPGPEDRCFKIKFTKSDYIKIIHQALEHIRRGDIYQINLSHKITVSQRVPDPALLYRHLREAFPSEFGAYFHDGKQAILSASPERFLQLHNGIAQVKPMKGTRPRGKTKAQDQRLKEELKNSRKETAELLMVTDLERNDLGRVCEYASVKVKSMRTIATYASVFQATSTIEGRLRKDCDRFDLLKAAFPSGSVTGCPKIEAMKIIRELEHGSRGLYTGALGYMSFTGDMDFNVMIRTIFLKSKELAFHVGGGIVADSRPEAEWQETWVKARPMMEALRKYRT